MSDQFSALYRIVRHHLSGDKPRVRLREVRDAILFAHMYDRRDGTIVTWENSGLFRLYRNNVSPNPQHLIDAARNHKEEDAHEND